VGTAGRGGEGHETDHSTIIADLKNTWISKPSPTPTEVLLATCLIKHRNNFKDVQMRNVRFQIFTAVTMKNGVFWDIKPQFLLHRRHINYVSTTQFSQLMLCKI
jgi:hypothetical protein